MAFVCPQPEGGVCGLVEVLIHPIAPECKIDRIGYLEAWYVDPNCRCQGIGREVAQQAELWATAEGYLEIASDTNPSYPPSPRAHLGLGYQEVERYYRKDLK